jgi:hypothetical protein
MMLRVIDTIDLRETWTHRYPELMAKGEGLLVIVDPAGVNESVVGGSVTVRRPDGTAITLVVDGVERGASDMPGLFFRGLTRVDIPTGSTIAG